MQVVSLPRPCNKIDVPVHPNAVGKAVHTSERIRNLPVEFAEQLNTLETRSHCFSHNTVITYLDESLMKLHHSNVLPKTLEATGAED